MLDVSVNAAADEMIQYLTSENEKLSEEVKELKNELVSIRQEYENLLSFSIFSFLECKS